MYYVPCHQGWCFRLSFFHNFEPQTDQSLMQPDGFKIHLFCDTKFCFLNPSPSFKQKFPNTKTSNLTISYFCYTYTFWHVFSFICLFIYYSLIYYIPAKHSFTSLHSFYSLSHITSPPDSLLLCFSRKGQTSYEYEHSLTSYK